jgi:hypothetical protein
MREIISTKLGISEDSVVRLASTIEDEPATAFSEAPRTTKDLRFAGLRAFGD